MRTTDASQLASEVANARSGAQPSGSYVLTASLHPKSFSIEEAADKVHSGRATTMPGFLPDCRYHVPRRVSAAAVLVGEAASKATSVESAVLGARVRPKRKTAAPAAQAAVCTRSTHMGAAESSPVEGSAPRTQDALPSSMPTLTAALINDDLEEAQPPKRSIWCDATFNTNRKIFPTLVARAVLARRRRARRARARKQRKQRL